MERIIQYILDILEETQKIEFKRLSGAKVVNKIIETIVAMTNTDGGSVILGVSDPEEGKYKGTDRIFGIEENLDLYDSIGREVQKIIPPCIGVWEPELIKVKDIDKTIAIINIPKSVGGFKSINKNVFLRQKKSNKRLTPEEIIELNYAKGFDKADKELVDVDFELLETEYYETWRRERKIPKDDIGKLLFKTGLARKNKKGKILPTRAAVLLFAEYPTNILDTKCTIRVYKYQGVTEKFEAVPNLVGEPKTMEGPVIKLINEAHTYILGLLESGVEMHSGFITKYKIPQRAVKEAITNAVIHRDYHIKRDIEVRIFEDRIDVLSPGLFIGNITVNNIGTVRANEYRNDSMVKELREFPDAPNLDRNEGVQAMRSEMSKNNLYPPIFITYPQLEDSVKVVLLNEEQPTEWEKIKKYLENNNYINNQKAREITGIVQVYRMSRLLKKWVENGLIVKIDAKNKKDIKYKLYSKDELRK